MRDVAHKLALAALMRVANVRGGQDSSAGLLASGRPCQDEPTVARVSTCALGVKFAEGGRDLDGLVIKTVNNMAK